MHIEQCEPVGDEKRSAFRCPVQETVQWSVLRVRKKKLPVQLLDESAGGFALLADRHPGVEAGDVVRLCTESGWHEVRVVHVRKYEPAVAEGEPVGENGGPQFRVGLERVRDLAPREAPGGLRAWLDRLGIGNSLPWFSSTAMAGIVLALSVTAALAAGAVLFSRMGDSSPTRHNPLSRPGEPLSSGVASQSAGESSRLAATTGQLPGSSPFTLKEMTRELQLSRSQQAEIGRIISLSNEAVRQIPVRWPGQTREQQAEKRRILLDEAHRQALQLLSDEQRDRWEALQSGTDA